MIRQVALAGSLLVVRPERHGNVGVCGLYAGRVAGEWSFLLAIPPLNSNYPLATLGTEASKIFQKSRPPR
jgi:hypothetical protein